MKSRSLGMLLVLSLSLVAFSGCSGGGAKKKLVGKWEGKLEIDDSKLSGEEKAQMELAKAMLSAMKMELEFKSNGTASVSMNMMGQSQKHEGKWKVIKESGNSATISSPNPDGKEEQMEITFDGKNAFIMKPPQGDKSMPPGVTIRFTRK